MANMHFQKMQNISHFENASETRRDTASHAMGLL